MSDVDSFMGRPFPEDDWDQVWLDMAGHEVVYLQPDWAQQVAIPPPPPDCCIESECRAVLAAKNERAGRLGDILLQNDSLAAVLQPMEQLLRDAHTPRKADAPATWVMMGAALTDLMSGLFTLKKQFNRGRPYQCCNLPLEPLFARPDSRYPGHPSYPSGHSTQAHTFALLYGAIFPELQPRLLSVAYSIARNREIAGLHYGSDTEAGRMLAQAFVSLLLANEKFRPLFDAAHAEWI